MLERAHDARLIYLLDDDDVQRRLVSEYLESLQYPVHTFSSGTEVVSAVRARAPDILITDYMMPEGISGEQCAQMVRLLAPAVHIIVLSGSPRPADTIADHWIQKGSSALSELRHLLASL
jgi:CheY-like chemotaxis protein